MAETVRWEITDDPVGSELGRAIEAGDVAVVGPAPEDRHPPEPYERGEHLGRSDFAARSPDWTGDVALLGEALERSERVIVSDDKPLREACKVLSIPVFGSIGVPICAVERGKLNVTKRQRRCWPWTR